MGKVYRDVEIPDQVKLLDAGNNLVRWLSADDVIARLRRGTCFALTRKKRVVALKYTNPSRFLDDLPGPFVLRAGGLGDSHDRDTRDNARGVWTIEPISKKDRDLFLQVVIEAICQT
jgi:hypothetical protein